MVARDWGGGEWGATANGYGVSFEGDENILELESDEVYTIL